VSRAVRPIASMALLFQEINEKEKKSGKKVRVQRFEPVSFATETGALTS